MLMAMPLSLSSCVNSMAADPMAFPLEHVAQHAATSKRMRQVQFIDPAHQRQIRFTGFLRR